jgi:hypothetical protein
MKNTFTLQDQQSVADLQSYLQRAKRLDTDGMVRLRAFGPILAAYVAPIFAGSLMDSGPTVLGLRTTELAEPAEVDSVVPISAVLDRLARVEDPNWDGRKSLAITLPATERAPWAGISPPRTGWVAEETISEPVLTQLAKDGINEVKNTLPESVGGPIAARIRGEIWGRGIPSNPRIPTGAAFVAAGLGFLTENEEVEIYFTDGWVRLSAEHGHVLAKLARSL